MRHFSIAVDDRDESFDEEDDVLSILPRPQNGTHPIEIRFRTADRERCSVELSVRQAERLRFLLDRVLAGGR